MIGMHNKFEDIWKIFPENALKGRIWHWWWWLYFFENPDRPDYPRQLMILWGTRNCRKVRINDLLWKPKITPEVHDGRARFEAMVASWYYDGKKMHDPFILEKGPTKATWDKEHGSIAMRNEHGTYSFEGRDADFRLKAENPKLSIDLRMKRWTDEMSKLVSTGKVFFRNMGYSMLKYRGLKASGKVRVGSSEITVEGRAYFQKVRLSSITPAWYWAVLQSDKGAYMQYFVPHVGITLLRQRYSHESSLDWGEKTISRTLNFYDPEEEVEHTMKIMHVKKRYDNDLPIFTIEARSPTAKLTAEMSAYARCCWNITQPVIRPLWLGIFYNEYPARLLKLKFTNGRRVVDKDDLGLWFCNCEHSWGTM
jgi:hypothetical protein